MKQLNSKEWYDVADLLEQFATDCENAYEDHERASKKWLKNFLLKQSLTAHRKGVEVQKKEDLKAISELNDKRRKNKESIRAAVRKNTQKQFGVDCL